MNEIDNKYYNMAAKGTKLEPLRIKFDLSMMNTFCSYVLSDNSFIHRHGLTNLRELLVQIDPSVSLDNNQSLIDRYNLCMDVLDSRLNKNLSKKELIISDIQGLMKEKYPDLTTDTFPEICATDVQWIESDIVPRYLNAALIYNSIQDLQEACHKYTASSPDQMEKRINDLYDKIDNISTKKRRNEIDADTEDSLFQVSNFENTVTKIWNTQKSEGYKLRTGIQSLNKMLNGGLEGGRVYCFFGPSGGGKSLTIANLLYQIKKFNTDIKTKDKTLKPCICLLTMENMLFEVVQTLYNIVVANEDISNRPLDEVLNLIKNSDMFIDENGERNPIEIFIKFKPINSITTDYLYKITEDLKDEGYEVVCMFQDYIMRIKSVERSYVEDRVKYGNIINEFKNYAMYYSIPVVTAAQLNRDASKTIDSYTVDGNFDDMIDHIGRANIAESAQIDFNLDAIIFIVPCWRGDIKWQAFKLVKHRYKANLMASDYVFFHPFTPGMPARLEIDLFRAAPLSENNLLYDQKTSDSAKVFSKASARFSKNKDLKNDDTIIINDHTEGFLNLNVPKVDEGRQDYDDGKPKLSIVNMIEEENIDENTFNQLIDQIIKIYKVPQLKGKYKYIEDIDYS